MAVIKLKNNPPDRELRQFAGIWLPLFCVAVAVIAYSRGSMNTALATIAIGLFTGVIGYLHVAFVRPIYLGWMYAAYPIGWVVSHLVLAIVYYGVVTPIGWLMRRIGYDPLERQFARSASTYWSPIEARADKTSYFRQF
jgi:hypothetical protein